MGAVGGIFGGISKMVRSVLYLVSGKANRIGEIWSAHPDAIAGAYKDVIDQKHKRIVKIKDAIIGLQSLHDQKILKLKDIVSAQEKDKEVQEAIIAELKVFVDKKQNEGLSKEEIESQNRYIELINHYTDISDTIEQRQGRIEEMEELIIQGEQDLKDYISEIKDLHRELDKLKQEAQEAEAEVLLAKEEQALSELRGDIIVTDKSTAELQELRRRVQKVKSAPKISKALAGTDAKRERRNLLAKHRQSRKSQELSQLLFQASETDTKAKETKTEGTADVKLPE